MAYSQMQSTPSTSSLVTKFVTNLVVEVPMDTLFEKWGVTNAFAKGLLYAAVAAISFMPAVFGILAAAQKDAPETPQASSSKSSFEWTPKVIYAVLVIVTEILRRITSSMGHTWSAEEARIDREKTNKLLATIIENQKAQGMSFDDNKLQENFTKFRKEVAREVAAEMSSAITGCIGNYEMTLHYDTLQHTNSMERRHSVRISGAD